MGAHLPWFVLACVACGLAFPEVFSPLHRIMVPLFALMTFSSTLGGGFRELGQVLLHPMQVIVTLVLLHVVLPLIALGMGTLLFPQAPLFTTGLVLEYTIPTAVSSLMWVGIAGGNSSLCLSIVLLDTLLSPVVIPFSLRLLVGTVVEMDTAGMMQDMVLMVALPALCAMTLFQLTGGKVAVTLKPKLSLFSKLALLTMVVINSTGCVSFLQTVDKTLVLVMLSVVVLCLVGFVLGYWVPKLLRRPYPDCAAGMLSTGMRNISAGSVLATAYFPPEVLFPVAFTPLFLQMFTSLAVKLLMSSPSAKAYAAEPQEAKP